MADDNKKVCNQCPNHCPISNLKCSEGRKAMQRANQGQGEYAGQEGRHGHERFGGRGMQGKHQDRGGRHGDRDRRGGRDHEAYHGDGRPHMDEDSLPGLLQACGHQMHHRGRKGGGQEGIISILAEKEQMSQKELNEILQIQPGSLSEILTKLEQKDLITREKDAEDKRKCIVKLTPAGKTAAQGQKPRLEEDNMFSVLSNEEQSQLKAILKKLLAFWKN